MKKEYILYFKIINIDSTTGWLRNFIDLFFTSLSKILNKTVIERIEMGYAWEKVFAVIFNFSSLFSIKKNLFRN